MQTLMNITGSHIKTSKQSLAPYALPSYFQARWDPSFNIYGSGLGGYSTNYNPDSDKPTGTTKYVDVATGDDTTGNGTQALPYKTLQKAYDEGADIISAAGGWYDKANGFNTNFNPAHDLAIESTNSNTVFINRAEVGLSWTEEATGTRYSVTVADPSNVVDMTNGRTGLYLVDGTTLVPLRLTEVASTALERAPPEAGSTMAQTCMSTPLTAERQTVM